MEPNSAQCLCWGCGEQASISRKTCNGCRESLLLHDQYRIVRVLGQNNGITWEGIDEQTRQRVVIKEQSIATLASWKEQELFQREIMVMQKPDRLVL
ncbi:MAG: hypothetical protein JW904_15865 [Spirochaetales bacterium]|nr:hypothetical protein [Spirochaetales bacterium]